MHRVFGRWVAVLLLNVLPGWSSEPAGFPPVQDAMRSTTYAVRRWGTQHGVPSDSVTVIGQTQDGYLWVGTEAGLARFDGVRFVSYATRGIPPVQIIDIVATPSMKGPWVVDLTRRLHLLDKAPPKTQVVGKIPRPSVAGEDGRIYGKGANAIADYSCDPPKIIRLPPTGLGEDSYPHCLIADGQGVLRAIIGDGVWTYREGRWIAPEDALKGGVEWLSSDLAGGFWIAGPQNILLHCRADGTRETFQPPGVRNAHDIQALTSTREGTLWGTTQGRGLWNVRNGVYQDVRLLDASKQPAVQCIYVDRSDDVWVGTANMGLFKISPSLVKTHALDGPVNGIVTALTESPEGGLLIGTRGDGTFTWRDGVLSPLAEELKRFPYGNCFLHASDGSLWVGTGNGLHRLVNGRKTNGDEFIYKYPGDSVIGLHETPDGAIWAVCATGMIHELREGRFVRKERLPVPIACVAREKNGTLWLGGPYGELFTLCPDGSISRFGNGNSTHLPDGARLSALCFDSNGNLWAGLATGGLCRLRDDRFQPVPTSEGDQGNSALQILDDGKGRLWYGGHLGISSICLQEASRSPEDNKICRKTVRLGLSDGMATTQCTKMTPLRARDGTLYFGTVRGFVSFRPEEVLAKLHTPQPFPAPVIEELRVNGGDDSLLVPGSHPDPTPESRLEIRFTAPDLSQAENLRFRYRMKGMDPDWIDSNGERHADYTNLKPGSYRFEVQAGSRLDEWSESVASLDIFVRPFFWQTWWFTTLGCTAIAALLVVPVIVLERRKAARSMEHQHRKLAVDQERARIARDLHDGIGCELTHAIQLAERLDGPDDRRPRSGGLTRQVREQLRNLARDVDIAVWTADPAHDRLPPFCSYLVDYAAEIFSSSPIRFRIAQGVCPDIPLTPTCRHELFMIAKGAINNILRHSHATEATLALGVEDGSLRLSISDNGVGFSREEAEKKQRNGLSCMRHRAANLGTSLELLSREGGGTTVAVLIPLERLTMA